MYDRKTPQGATFNMRGQLYRGHANATALFSSPVVSALGSKSDDPGQGVVLLRRVGKKKCEAWRNLYITVLYTCLQVLTRRICLIIKGFISW